MALNDTADSAEPVGSRIGDIVLTVHAPSDDPPFRQLRDQLGQAIRSGALAPGTQVPPVRTLAAQVGVAANTAAKVYRDLEDSGLLESRGRSGTFVAHTDSRDAAVHRAAADFTQIAIAAGYDARQACSAVENAFTQHQD